MIDRAEFNYSPISDTVSVFLYVSDTYVGMIDCDDADFSFYLNPEFSSYWVRMNSGASFFTVQITKDVFDYLTERRAIYEKAGPF